MKRYDPETNPSAEEWLALEEDERQRLIERYHRHARIRLPNARLHAMMHMVVENQLAMADPPAIRALERLRREGLTRHDAIHAIASVLADFFYEALHGDVHSGSGAADSYYLALEQLTAEKWRNG